MHRMFSLALAWNVHVINHRPHPHLHAHEYTTTIANSPPSLIMHLITSLSRDRHCFVSVPASLFHPNPIPTTHQILRLTWLHHTIYVGWCGGITSTSTHTTDTIIIPSTLASCAGLTENIRVDVSIVPSHVAKMVHVTPISSDAWEMLELNAGWMEHHLLEQVCMLIMLDVLCILYIVTLNVMLYMYIS